MHKVNSIFNLHSMVFQAAKKDLIHERGVQSCLDVVPTVYVIGMFQKGAFFDQQGNSSLMLSTAKWVL